MELPSLQRLSSICIAIRIWESPSIKMQISFAFQLLKNMEYDLVHQYEYHDNRYVFWNNESERLFDSAVKVLNSLELPQQLKEDCRDVVEEISTKICDWIGKVTLLIRFDFKFAEKIYFKSDGTLDQSKICESWESDKDFLKQRPLGCETCYILACIIGNENFIAKNLVEMEKIIKKRLSNFDLNNYEDKIETIVTEFLDPFYYHNNGELRDIFVRLLGGF